jgi:hypothetical protein
MAMARNADPHPEPNDPNDGPAPKFPPGGDPLKNVTPPRPGLVTPEPDVPAPARDPFPDHLPDPGVRKQ